MALTNFSLPFGAFSQSGAPWSATVPPLHPIHQQLAANTNNLLYSPADHQPQHADNGPPPPGSDFYKNNPYAAPQQTSYQYNSNNNNNNGRRKNTYLPPLPAPGSRNSQQQFLNQQHPSFQHHQQQQFSHINTHQQQQVTQNINSDNNNNNIFKSALSSSVASSTSFAATANKNSNTRTYGEGTYTRFPQEPLINNNNNNNDNNNNININNDQQQTQYFNSFSSASQQEQHTKHLNTAIGSSAINTSPPQTFPKYGVPNQVEAPAATYGAAAPATANKADNSGLPLPSDSSSNDPYPERPPGFTRVQAGQGSKTRVHAVLDYDLEEGEEEDYYDTENAGEPVNKDGSPKTSMSVTPIQGPIYLKNGTVPVVPLFHYPSFNNGSFVQIPIWWTALSVALGLDVRGDLIKGVPCIKRYHQLFCPTAGNSYPIDKIERFIDDNKALMRRMYGDFEMKMSEGGPRQQTKKRKRRFIDEPDIFLPPGVYPTFVPDDKVESHAEEHGESYFGKLRNKRQTNQGNRNAKQTQNFPRNGSSSTGRLDACESKVEIVTPYWASNSAGKIRAIVNTQHFEQAIHQEICSKAQTSRCQGECGCEQKYKWHRLLSYDPDNDCKGIFMDWFLFPSCCVCRCNP